jgi:purine-binding chemotaxis protein CheW
MTASTALATTASTTLPALQDMSELLTVYLGDQIFGLPILQVQDVLGPQNVTHIPLVATEIAGALNLRGRIVTAIRMRERLGLPHLEQTSRSMSVVVEFEGELYSLSFDRVGEVMNLPVTDYEPTPSTLDPKFQDVADGIYRLSGQLLVVLDIPKMLRGLSGYSQLAQKS